MSETDAAQVVETPVDVVAEAPEVVDAVDVTPEPDVAPEPPKAQTVPVSVVTGLRAKARELEAENARLAREASDAKAVAERLAGGEKTAPQAPAVDDAEIDRRADYKLFVRDVQSMQAEGLKEFGPAFNERVRILEAVGAADDNFVSQVMAVDRPNAHKLLNKIAEDPERAVALVQMNPTQRIAEITRIAMATAAPKTEVKTEVKPEPKPVTTKAISRAPAPPPPVEPSSSKTVDWRTDEASDAEFDAGFKAMMQRRSAAR
jgi:hypothetical protein